MKSALSLAALALLATCHPKTSAKEMDADAVADAASDASMDATSDAPNETDAGPSDARPSEGCFYESAVLPAGLKTGLVLDVGGKKRTYVQFAPTPKKPRKPLRLVFGFHGDVRTGEDVRAALDLERHANDEAIFVYPDGLGMTWRTEDGSAKNPDFVFFDALLDHVARSACIDRGRVFVAGFSRGAFFANQLACRREIRAIAPVAGGGPYVLPGDVLTKGALVCPAKPPAVLLFHGEADPNVGIGSGRASRDFWQKANGCKKTTTAFEPPPCVAFDECSEGRSVVWCSLPKHGHRVANEAPAAIWSFFRKL